VLRDRRRLHLRRQSKLEEHLKKIQASPIRVVTKEAVEKASMDILYRYTKESEVHIEDLKHRLADAKAQNLIARTQSLHETVEEQERQQVSQAKFKSMEDSLEHTHRELDYLQNQHKSQEDERRSNAAQMSRTMNMACKHFKNPSVSDQELEAVGKIFKEPIQMLTKQDVSISHQTSWEWM
jgi:hypothetical protein